MADARHRPVLLGALALAAFAILIGLGTWQLQRGADKTALIARLDDRARASPVPLATVLAEAPRDLPAREYTRVSITGQFRHERELTVWTVAKAGAGYAVITPLATADGLVVPVIRGFVPPPLRDPSSRPAGQIANAVTLIGRIRLDERTGPFTPANDAARDVWYARNLAQMRARLTGGEGTPLAPLFVELDSPAPPGGWPKPDLSTLNLTNNHLQYALTWFGLAATLIGVFIAFVWRPRARKP